MTTLTVDVDRTLAFPNTLPMIDTVRFINSDAGGVPMATLTLAAREFDDVHFRSTAGYEILAKAIADALPPTALSGSR